jgi:Fe-S-cluster-containing hydrogenase component 2/CRP-like cAMP-binding protein
MNEPAQEIIDLNSDWNSIAKILEEIPGAKVGDLKKYSREAASKSGVHFFVVQYSHGTVIMAKGTTSDYAAIHLQGIVRVRHAEVKQETSGPGCWHDPRLRRLADVVLNPARPGQNRQPAGAVHPKKATDKAASEPEAPTGRRPRVSDRMVAAAALRHPGVPLWVLDTLRLRMGNWGLSRAPLFEQYLSRILQSRLRTLESVNRSERKLGDPASAATAVRPPGASGQPVQESSASAEFAREALLSVRDKTGQKLPIDRRFMGLSGALWNRPRSVTLIAENDPADKNAPCVMLLIKRKALQDLFKSPEGKNFLKDQLQKFLEQTLPELLANNRLFADLFYSDDIQDWGRLLEGLRNPAAADPLAAQLANQLIAPSAEFRAWLDSEPALPLHEADQARAVAALNWMLTDGGLRVGPAHVREFPGRVRAEAEALLERGEAATASETCRLRRLALESAMPGAFKESPRPWPLFPEEFRKLAKDLQQVNERLGLESLQPDLYEQDQVLFKEGDPADALYLVLSGMVRVFRTLPGGETAANNLEVGSFFGEAAFLDEIEAGTEQEAGVPAPAKRAAGVKPLCKSYLLKLERSAFKELVKAPEYEWLCRKIRNERRRVLSQNELFRSGWVIIPRDPPPSIAERLVVTRNILLINMDRCTRCDQCVQGCAAAHDAQPRFHRANPELRFGKWEVARACMHCLDAPCMEACPVGAITLLDDKAVQIHRTRCIGCTKCESACSFGVIDMYDPVTRHDGPSTKTQVANKCDLCLTEDNDPPCVAWCPYDAAQRVDPNEFFRGLKARSSFSDRVPLAEAKSSPAGLV